MILEDFYNIHKFVTLTADVIYVNENAFMITPVRKLKLGNVEHILSWTFGHLNKSLNKMIKLYGRDGLIIHVILMDMDLEKVMDTLVKLEVNVEAAQERMGEVERKTIMVKERGRRIINTLYYFCIPSQITNNIC